MFIVLKLLVQPYFHLQPHLVVFGLLKITLFCIKLMKKIN